MNNQDNEVVESLSLEDLELRLAPAPIWAGGAFPGKVNDNALANASSNAAFFKFVDAGDGGDGGDDGGDYDEEEEAN